MKVIGKAKLIYNQDYITCGMNNYNLEMKVKFKTSNKLLSTTLKKDLATYDIFNRKREFKNYNEFLDECLKIITNKEYLSEEAKGMILDYFIKQKDLTNEDQKLNIILKEVKNNEFTIEVEI